MDKMLDKQEFAQKFKTAQNLNKLALILCFGLMYASMLYAMQRLAYNSTLFFMLGLSSFIGTGLYFIAWDSVEKKIMRRFD